MLEPTAATDMTALLGEDTRDDLQPAAIVAGRYLDWLRDLTTTLMSR